MSSRVTPGADKQITRQLPVIDNVTLRSSYSRQEPAGSGIPSKEVPVSRGGELECMTTRTFILGCLLVAICEPAIKEGNPPKEANNTVDLATPTGALKVEGKWP